MRSLFMLISLSVAAAGGCGNSDGGTSTSSGTWSCIQSVTINGVTESTICVEYMGLTPDQIKAYQSVCASNDGGVGDGDLGLSIGVTGSSASGPCTRKDAIGGCSIMAGGFTETMWWYASGASSVDIAKSSCATIHGTFVMP